MSAIEVAVSVPVVDAASYFDCSLVLDPNTVTILGTKLTCLWTSTDSVYGARYSTLSQ